MRRANNRLEHYADSAALQGEVQKGVSPIIYNYFSPVPAAGEAFVAGVFVLARDKGSMAGNLVACVLLS